MIEQIALTAWIIVLAMVAIANVVTESPEWFKLIAMIIMVGAFITGVVSTIWWVWS